MASNYPSNIESKIGFDQVRFQLVELCQSHMGVSEVEKMEFSSSYLEVTTLLKQVAEMKRMMESSADAPDVAYHELGRWLPALKVEGSYGSAEQFQWLRGVLNSFANVRIFFLKREGKEDDSPMIYPHLGDLFSNLELFPELTKSIDRVIDKNGLVKDSASPELAEVRQRLSGMQGSIARSIQRIFSQAVREGIAEKDAAPTFRDGRMVIPVSAGNKRSMPGIVHDESATGKTVFIEPAETVELSNRLRELQLEEQRIIVKILTALTAEIRPYIDSILAGNLLLGKMDFIMAKARYALSLGADMPNIAKRPEIEWYGAVHPVLLQNLRNQGRETVPLNIRLDGRKRFLVISGPNAGGKSVALKTVGIVQYMFQCGILPTLYSNSHMGIFDRIFIDIGDEQSIENDLSTYSSHLRNMRYFLLHAGNRSLVLIDEIGSGTEPTIGASLSQAILTELARSRCFGIVTTHYHSLKRFAEEQEAFVNGAMLYDRQKLQPTFQLSIGTAGSSFALEIASKIGLPRNVIEAAKQEVGEEYVESDKFLMEIARDRKYWQQKRNQIKERENKLEKLEQDYEKLVGELKLRRREIIREAQEEARQLLSGANRRIENTILEIRQAEAEKERTKRIRKELEEFKQEVEEADKTTDSEKIKVKLPRQKKNKKKTESRQQETIPNPEANKELEAGDYVKMTGANGTGRILNIRGKEAEVAFGNLRTKVKLSKLSITGKPKQGLADGTGYTLLNSGGNEASRQRQLNFKDELDIRGARADEALDRLTHFIDDATQFGIKKVRVLHGTGAGILRQLVRQQLSVTPGIVSYEDEDVRLGGAGITVVTIK